jgi:hypothetical protein
MKLTHFDREYLLFLAEERRQQLAYWKFQKDIYAIFNKRYQ